MFAPVRIAGELIRPHLCRDCQLRADTAAAEAAAEELRRAEAEQRRAETRREGHRLELLQRITGNAAEHRSMTLDAFDPAECGQHVLQELRGFYEEVRAAGPHDPVRGLLLCGGTGLGKTHAVVAAGINGLLEDPEVDPESIVFDRADELIMRIQDCYGRSSVFDEILDRRFSARLWTLDDLGTEKATEDAARLLNLIFSRRALRPTAVTMNGDLDELEQARPELFRLVSRFGPRYFRVVPMDGRDRRFDA